MNSKNLFLFLGLTILNYQNISAQVHQSEVRDQGKVLKLWFNAAKSNDLELFKTLHEHVNVNAKNSKGKTALFIAASFGSKQIVEFLLTNPNLDVNAQSNKKQTALMGATASMHYDIVKILLEVPKIDINIQDKSGNSAFTLACTCIESESEKLVKLFLTNPDLNINIQNKWGLTPLMLASHLGYTAVVDQLLQHKNIDVNFQNDGLTALTCAVLNQKESIVKLLLQRPEINIHIESPTGKSAYILACDRPEGNNIRQLLAQYNADFDKKLRLLNHQWLKAAFNGQLSKMQNLENSIDINIKNIKGMNALMFAAEERHISLVTYLLSKPHIDINAQNYMGRTALIIAAQAGTVPIIAALLAIPHIDVNIQDENGVSALMYAAKNSHKEVVQLLLRVPAINIEAKDNDGNDALMLAKDSRGFQTIKILIKSKLEEVQTSAQSAKKETDSKKRKISDEQDISKKCSICPKKCELRCSGCKIVYYCSQACQKADWKVHKQFCKQKTD